MGSASGESGIEPGERFDFASLTPANADAIASFRTVNDRLRQQPSDAKHHFYYCRLDAPTEPLHIESTASDLSFNSDNDTALAVPVVEPDGCYLLSIIPAHPPSEPKFGWTMGSGRWEDDTTNGGVDILVAGSPDISDRHLAFRFDGHGRLELNVRHGIVEMDGEPVTRASSRLVSHTKHIKVGPQLYRFAHIVPKDQEVAFQKQKTAFLKKHSGLEQVPHELTSATPSVNDLKIGDWVIHGAVSRSATAVVDAASNTRTKDAVAVKRLRRLDIRSAQSTSQEIGLYKALQSIKNHEHSRYVMQMHSVLYHRDQEEWQGGIDEVFLLWTPLGAGTFDDLYSGKWSPITHETKLKLFCQICLGLQAVHEAGWIHRDIKPQNLYVVSFTPLRAVVGDFGGAIRSSEAGWSPRPGTCGTIGWLAPELENPQYAIKYRQGVDVWSLGAVGYTLFESARRPWMSQKLHNTFLHPTDPAVQAYQSMMRHLSNHQPDTLKGLLFQMLQAYPVRRTTLRGALANPVLQPILSQLRDENGAVGASIGSKRPAPQSDSQ
ncbi:MAG: hypothetical protein L6R41_000598 [Letrouitia leprolyta]|nr:MAG: hypothetical protein L6R41_000598 [Letrouitia leprolyta]